MKMTDSTQFDSADYYIFKCWCGEHSYLEVSIDKEDGDAYFTITQYPTTLFDRIKLAFRALRGLEFTSSNSVMIEKSDFIKFATTLSEAVVDKK